MSFHLLYRLAQEELPVRVTGGEDIDMLRVLRLAGHVLADIPAPVRTLRGHHQPAALVHAVTPMGRRMIKMFPPSQF